MARTDICTTCGEVKEIRRRSGQCDSCYHREYRNRPGIRERMAARATVWKRQHNEHVRAYNRHYYETMKGTDERSSGQARGTEEQD